MSSLSILVPRIGPKTAFENSLASVLRYRLPDQQLIVVDGPGEFDRFGLEDEVDFLSVPDQVDSGIALNVATRVATGDAIQVLMPGLEVTEGWHERVSQAFACEHTGTVALPIVTGRRHGILRGLSLNKAFVARMARADSERVSGPLCGAGVFRKAMLEQIGVVDHPLDDVWCGLDLALAGERMGWQCRAVSDARLTMADRRVRLHCGGLATGRMACRLLRRHGQKNRSLRDRLGTGLYWAASVVQPPNWSEWIGFRGGRRFEAVDQAFFEQVELAVQRGAGGFAPATGDQAATRSARAA